MLQLEFNVYMEYSIRPSYQTTHIPYNKHLDAFSTPHAINPLIWPFPPASSSRSPCDHRVSQHPILARQSTIEIKYWVEFLITEKGGIATYLTKLSSSLDFALMGGSLPADFLPLVAHQAMPKVVVSVAMDNYISP